MLGLCGPLVFGNRAPMFLRSIVRVLPDPIPRQGRTQWQYSWEAGRLV